MTNLALSWGIPGNYQLPESSSTENYCILCRKKINLNYLHKKACYHTFCAFCCSLSMEQCLICGFSSPPQLKFHDNTSDSKLPD